MSESQQKSNAHGFFKGLASGAIGSMIGAAAILFVLSRGELVSFSSATQSGVNGWLSWLVSNLGWSLPVFALLFGAFAISLVRLRKKLEADRPTTEIVQLDHMAETWTTLFFGTGVIWTAIGMRSALLFALGDPDATAQQGAFAVLERMVDGGILLALSTTIFGGAGGYLMRVYKSVALGNELQQHYERAAREDSTNMNNTLERIEQHLTRRDDKDVVPRTSTG